MVSIACLVKCVLRYDTVLSWAMRRALGIKQRPRRKPELSPVPLCGRDANRVDREVLECFRNEGRSPVEWG